MGAVHRLNVGGSALAEQCGAGLRYSRFPPRGGLWEERGAIASRESPQVLRIVLRPRGSGRAAAGRAWDRGSGLAAELTLKD